MIIFTSIFFLFFSSATSSDFPEIYGCFCEGGIISGPETGYLAVLHVKESIIPEEKRYTRSRCQSQGLKQNIFIFQDGDNKKTQSQQVMQTPKTQVVPIFVPADPFDVATKYSELIAKVTV